MTVAYPLQWPEGWPRTTLRSSSSPFKLTWEQALERLRWELQRAGAKNIVLSSWLELRRDGLPRADKARDARIADPGVAVYFTRKGKPMVMARDEYRTVCDNLISLYHAVCHLRGLERHGGGHMMERAFTGFVALSDKPHWKSVLAVGDTAPQSDLASVEKHYKILARAHYRDEARLKEINVARDQARKELRQSHAA